MIRNFFNEKSYRKIPSVCQPKDGRNIFLVCSYLQVLSKAERRSLRNDLMERMMTPTASPMRIKSVKASVQLC